MKKRNTPYITTVSKCIVTLVLTVFINWTALADEVAPGDFGGGDDPLDEPVVPVPIDDYLGALILLGIVFAFYKNRLLARKSIN